MKWIIENIKSIKTEKDMRIFVKTMLYMTCAIGALAFYIISNYF